PTVTSEEDDHESNRDRGARLSLASDLGNARLRADAGHGAPAESPAEQGRCSRDPAGGPTRGPGREAGVQGRQREADRLPQAEAGEEAGRPRRGPRPEVRNRERNRDAPKRDAPDRGPRRSPQIAALRALSNGGYRCSPVAADNSFTPPERAGSWHYP